MQSALSFFGESILSTGLLVLLLAGLKKMWLNNLAPKWLPITVNRAFTKWSYRFFELSPEKEYPHNSHCLENLGFLTSSLSIPSPLSAAGLVPESQSHFSLDSRGHSLTLTDKALTNRRCVSLGPQMLSTYSGSPFSSPFLPAHFFRSPGHWKVIRSHLASVRVC